MNCIRCGQVNVYAPTSQEAQAVPFARRYCKPCIAVRTIERESQGYSGVITEQTAERQHAREVESVCDGCGSRMINGKCGLGCE